MKLVHFLSSAVTVRHFSPFSLRFSPFVTSLQHCHILLSPPVSSTCPSPTPPPTPPLFPRSWFFLSENSYPFAQSFHFFFHSPPIPLSEARSTESNGGGKNKSRNMCVWVTGSQQKLRDEGNSIMQFVVMVSGRSTPASSCTMSRPACSKWACTKKCVWVVSGPVRSWCECNMMQPWW